MLAGLLDDLKEGASVTPHALGAAIARHAPPGGVTLLGLTGSVASGKSTLASALTEALQPRRAAAVSTDGFLLKNAELEARGLTMRKGFPESYDAPALMSALSAARSGRVRVPGYSHITYDVDEALAREIAGEEVVIFEGLGLAPHAGGENPARALDALIYLDAKEALLERWFLARFMRFWRAAEHDPASFYVRFRTMSEPDAEVFAKSVWERINLANLRDHISKARDHAHIVLAKQEDHSLIVARLGAAS